MSSGTARATRPIERDSDLVTRKYVRERIDALGDRFTKEVVTILDDRDEKIATVISEIGTATDVAIEAASMKLRRELAEATRPWYKRLFAKHA